MQDEPGGADLLQVAREALMGEVVPGLSGAQRYAALMVANAMRMVERELTAQERLRAADLKVRSFVERDGDSCEVARQTLCAAIRVGHLDGDTELHSALYAHAIEAVAITRPDILTPSERGQDLHRSALWGAVNGSDSEARSGLNSVRMR